MHPNKTVGTKYQSIAAKTVSNDPKKVIYKTIHMNLGGYMGSYVWFINGKPGYAAKPIKLLPAKRYRVIFHNKTMMHHPMHIHGHWFILRNGHGKYDPLLHTIDVPPGAKVIADFDTDASGQWFFHCHMLMHMLAGMNRVFQYASLLELAEEKRPPVSISHNTRYKNRPIVRVDKLRPISLPMVREPKAHGRGFFTSNLVELGHDFARNTTSLTYTGLFGPDLNKLQVFINDAEFKGGGVENFDSDFFFWHQLSRNWAIKGGVNYFNEPTLKPYWQIGAGFEALLPYFIEVNPRFYWHKGSLKLDLALSRDVQLFNNLFVQGEVRGIFATKKVSSDLVGEGLNRVEYTVGPYYRLMPGFSVFLDYEYTKYFGSAKHQVLSRGDRASENLFLVGLSVLL